MSDEDLKEKVAEGKNADDFVSNPRYQKAKVMIRADLFNQFESTKSPDSGDRDEIWRKLQSLKFIENSLERAIRDGKIAEKTLGEKIKGALRLAS